MGIGNTVALKSEVRSQKLEVRFDRLKTLTRQ